MSSKTSVTPPESKLEQAVGVEVENVHTNERVPGHPGYYEKGGLRTYGDDLDHDHEPPVSDLYFAKKQASIGKAEPNIFR